MPRNQLIPIQLSCRFSDQLSECFKEYILFLYFKKGKSQQFIIKKKIKADISFDPNYTHPSCADNLLQRVSSRSQPAGAHLRLQKDFSFPASSSQRLWRPFTRNLNKLGTCPGTARSLPVLLNPEAAQSLELLPGSPQTCNSQRVLEVKSISQLKCKLFCPSRSWCPNNITGHVFCIVVEILTIFKRLWGIFPYEVIGQIPQSIIFFPQPPNANSSLSHLAWLSLF